MSCRVLLVCVGCHCAAWCSVLPRLIAEAHIAGDKQTADVAVAAVWGLVKGNQRLLRPEANALGASGPALADPLLDIVLRGKVRLGVVFEVL